MVQSARSLAYPISSPRPLYFPCRSNRSLAVLSAQHLAPSFTYQQHALPLPCPSWRTSPLHFPSSRTWPLPRPINSSNWPLAFDFFRQNTRLLVCPIITAHEPYKLVLLAALGTCQNRSTLRSNLHISTWTVYACPTSSTWPPSLLKPHHSPVQSAQHMNRINLSF